MICGACGSPEVTWRGPLTAVTHAECGRCGAKNSQVDEGATPCEACGPTDAPVCEGCGCCQECCNCSPSDCDCDACEDRREAE